MTEEHSPRGSFRREHPIFFWGMATLLVLLLGATAVVAYRIPRYQREAALLDQRMDQAERETRDRILQSRTRRSELAVALLQREMRLKAMQEKNLHLAISTEDSILAFRHGSATLRQVPVQIGPDSVIQAPDGRTWRFVRALGERHLQDKQVSPTYTVPEWVYVARQEPVPPEEERQVEGGLGRYVLRLDDGTEIYSRPKEGPLAEGVKPAAFVVESESDMRAIFDAIRADMPVYIY